MKKTNQRGEAIVGLMFLFGAMIPGMAVQQMARDEAEQDLILADKLLRDPSVPHYEYERVESWYEVYPQPIPERRLPEIRQLCGPQGCRDIKE